ncbi:MAG: LPS export ABC transporter permease LptG, partial [Thiotrichaceae bacterium]
MNILNRYLWKNALGGIIMAWFALVSLDSFFALINELEDTSNSYGTVQAVLYIIYTLPERLYEYFPTSILVGALLGLGRLSANSEFTAMRAAGVSIQQIAIATLQLGVFLAFIAFALGEWVVPATDRYAVNFKAVQKNNNVALTSDRGLWVKEQQEIIQIGKVISNQHLADITIYRVSDNYKRLKDLTTIDTAEFKNNQWELHNVTTRTFKNNTIHTDKINTAYTAILIEPDILKVTVANPQHLSSIQLAKLIEHQEDNNLSADKFKLAFWKHFSVPFSALVMLILAMPFLFTSQRSAGV